MLRQVTENAPCFGYAQGAARVLPFREGRPGQEAVRRGSNGRQTRRATRSRSCVRSRLAKIC